MCYSIQINNQNTFTPPNIQWDQTNILEEVSIQDKRTIPNPQKSLDTAYFKTCLLFTHLQTQHMDYMIYSDGFRHTKLFGHLDFLIKIIHALTRNHNAHFNLGIRERLKFFLRSYQTNLQIVMCLAIATSICFLKPVVFMQLLQPMMCKQLAAIGKLYFY